MGLDAGAAYVFKSIGGTWVQQIKLTASDPRPNDLFGFDVAVSGDTVVVGACNTRFGTGAAYVFRNSGGQWNQEAKLLAGDGVQNDFFGCSVDVDDGVAIVGAYRNTGTCVESGAAYVFEYQFGHWNPVDKLTPSSGQPGDQFGRSVAVSGDWAAVAAIGDDQRGSDAGAVRFFQKSGTQWVETQKVAASDAQTGSFFGFSLDLSGDWAIVGASAHDGSEVDSGAVFMFQRSGSAWSERKRLQAPDASPRCFFGRCVAISGNWAIVGADGHDAKGLNAGAAYLFEMSGGTWAYRSRLTAGDGGADDRYGWPVGIATDGTAIYNAAVGLHGSSSRASLSGAVYFYGGPSIPEIDVIPDRLTIHEPPPPSSPETVADMQKDGDERYPRGLVVPTEVIQYWKLQARPPKKPAASVLPSSMDWSGYDSPVKSQGGCGSCAVFAAVALAENLMNRLELPADPDLSEQTVISCADRVNCVGSWPWETFKYINENGIPPESCFSYEGNDSFCSKRCPYPTFLLKIDQFTPSPGLWGEDPVVEDLKSALQQGPLVVAMFLPDDNSFDRYTGGVYTYSGMPYAPGAANGHAVLLVGYDDAERAFRAKNSWGVNWGESGYFRISYDEVENSMRFGSYAATASGAFLEGETSTFTIYNRGAAPLFVNGLTANPSWLNVSPNQALSIAANQSRVVSVTVDWDRMTSPIASGTIRIDSNDADEPSVMVTVSGVSFGVSSNASLADIDGIGQTNLADAVLGLRILAGISSANASIRPDYVAAHVDVSGDNIIGFEEVLYALQVVAELRE